jgi:hypothetical protein
VALYLIIQKLYTIDPEAVALLDRSTFIVGNITDTAGFALTIQGDYEISIRIFNTLVPFTPI